MRVNDLINLQQLTQVSVVAHGPLVLFSFIYLFILFYFIYLFIYFFWENMKKKIARFYQENLVGLGYPKLIFLFVWLNSWTV